MNKNYFGRTCEWCAEDLSRFYADRRKAPGKVFCSPKCLDNYNDFEHQFEKDSREIGSITINQPSDKTKELIDELYI